MTITGFDDIDATIAGLQALAAWRTAHPEITVFTGAGGGAEFLVSSARTDLAPAAIVRAIADGAPIGTVKKEAGTGPNTERSMFVSRSFGGEVALTYVANREQVCTRRVVGTETVEVPDPDAPLVTVEREIVEWDCAPILAAS